MTRFLGAMCAGAVLLVGCTPTPAPPPHMPPPPVAEHAALQERPSSPGSARPITASAAPDASLAQSDVVARIGTRTITKDQLLAPMIEAHGLNFLLHLVQLELARQAAAQQGVVVTPEDVKQERERTFQLMFKESDDALRAKLKEAIDNGDNDAAERLKAELNVDREALLDQYLVQQFAQSRQYVTRQEFDLVLETNANLRKIAEASPELKKALTEDMLKKAFAAQYGEKVVVRHIQATNITEISEARRRLQAGQNFAEVAKALSTNQTTGPLGGAVPPFTMNATNVPQVFRDTAFALKIGEISDPVQADDAYHLIKVDNRIAPKLVKYETVRDSLYEDLYERIVQAAVKQLRDKLQRQVSANLQIENPMLKAQYERRMEEGKVRQQAEIDEAMRRDRAATTPPADDDLAPTTAPAPTATPQKKPAAKAKAPTTKPTTKPAVSRKNPAK